MLNLSGQLHRKKLKLEIASKAATQLAGQTGPYTNIYAKLQNGTNILNQVKSS